MSEQEIVKTLLAPGRFSCQRCDQWSMDASSKAARHAAAEQGCDIGEAKQPPFLPGNGLLKQTGCSPATSGTGQQCAPLISRQIAESFAVVPRQVAPVPALAGRADHCQTP